MLWKTSLAGIKSQLKDYLILFSGLVIASAIFYMFESLATNEGFLAANSFISFTVLIFRLGTVLLSFITLVYVLYANSFLMTIRQRDYAMFMMLGARVSKIAQMIFIETVTIGIVSTVIGSLLGMGLTSVVSSLLINQLGLTVSGFSIINTQALLITTLFFVVLFFVAAVINARQIIKKPILSLLRQSDTPHSLRVKNSRLMLQGILGIILLAIGYYLMANIIERGFSGLIIAVAVIVIGTYSILRSLVLWIIQLLKNSEKIAFHKLTNFTLSQLSFRIKDYTKILTIVTILFALALGAITVGIGFRKEVPLLTQAATTYDLVLRDSQNSDQAKVNKLTTQLNALYSYKSDDSTTYFVVEEFDKYPFLMMNENSDTREVTYQEVSVSELKNNSTKTNLVRELLPAPEKGKTILFIPQAEFNDLSSEPSILQVVQVEDFAADLPRIKQLAEEDAAKNPATLEVGVLADFSQKSSVYDLFNSLYSGLEFMGFFLGIAFLAMLASCLMFKVLSGANSDIQRYELLAKIGTRTELMKQSIRRELGVLFCLPAILGILHVIFGLKLFDLYLADPYGGIWIPFTIFLLLYFIYYCLTVWMYTGIVLKISTK